MSRTKSAVMALLVLVMVVGLAACGQSQAAEVPDKAKAAKAALPVKSDGEIKLVQEKKLAFGVPGRIEEIGVKEGDRVSRGQFLARVETAPLERAVKVADLALKSGEADVRQAEFAVKLAQADVTQAENGLKAAEADVQQAGFGVKAATAGLNQAAIGLKTAETDLAIGDSNLSKIIYPYTYATFAFDVPQALDSISKAERQVAEAQKTLAQTGLTAAQYAEASRQLTEAQEDLADARQRLARGQGADVFVNGQASTQDFWTLRSAQLGQTRAELGVQNAASLADEAQLNLYVAKTAESKANLAADAARTVLDKAKVGLENARNTLDKSRIAAEKARYDFDSAKETLDKAVITAPFAGTAARISVKTGDILTAGDYNRTVIEFIDPAPVEASILVDEMDIPGVKIGQQASVSVDALPDAALKGTVNFVSALPQVRAGVVQYEVRITLPALEGIDLKSGMRCTATIDKATN